MNIYLPEQYEKFVREQVAGGRYANAAEVIRDGLRQLETGGRGFDQLWGVAADADNSRDLDVETGIME